jgi:hypothetical protein
MPTYLNRAISGDGTDTLVGNQIVYMAWRISTVDPMVRGVDPLNPDHVLRLGWISFGDSLDPFGFGAEDYWQPPIWLDFLLGLWVPSPSHFGGGVLDRFGTIIRWHLTGTSAGELHVFGL